MNRCASTPEDYTYGCHAICNFYAAVEIKAGRGTVNVADRRRKVGFVAFPSHLIENVCGLARRTYLVLVELNARFRKCFENVLGTAAAAQGFGGLPYILTYANRLHTGDWGRGAGSPVSGTTHLRSPSAGR